jgi:tetratricopeptide (TPR) repeat protein
MAQEKISRKKLLQEPDEFLSRSQQVWGWVHANQKIAGIIAGGIFAALLLAVGVKGYIEHSRGQRSDAVAEAVAKYTQAASGAIPADLRHEIAGLADRYAGSAEGAVARYLQAGALAAAGERDQARQMYTSLSAPGAKSGDLALLSRVALAYLDLAGGSADAALKAFQELLKTEGTTVPRAQIMMEIASIHEKQGRAAEARRVYEELIAGHPDGSWISAAKERLKQLPAGPAAS